MSNDKQTQIENAITAMLEAAKRDAEALQRPMSQQIAEASRRKKAAEKERQQRRKKAYQNAIWVCPHCQTEYVPTERRISDTVIVYTPNRDCRCPGFLMQLAEEEEVARLETEARHLAYLETIPQWQSFDPEWPPSEKGKEQLRHARKMVLSWYAGELPANGLMLAGDYGCGKSHLLRAIYRAYGVQGLHVEFITEPDLISWLTDKSISENYQIGRLKSSDVLVLDDVGAKKFNNQSEWLLYHLQSVYFRILDNRAEGDKKTLMTTNCRFKEIGNHIGGRALSRLEQIIGSYDNWIGLWDVPDYRAKGF